MRIDRGPWVKLSFTAVHSSIVSYLLTLYRMFIDRIKAPMIVPEEHWFGSEVKIFRSQYIVNVKIIRRKKIPIFLGLYGQITIYLEPSFPLGDPVSETKLFFVLTISFWNCSQPNLPAFFTFQFCHLFSLFTWLLL